MDWFRDEERAVWRVHNQECGEKEESKVDDEKKRNENRTSVNRTKM